MRPLQIHNTLTRKKELFAPRVAGKVGMYVCGPTVYDYFHIGNARTFTTFDMVVRWLRATGYEVTYVRNITDVDDKIIKRARDDNEPIEALTERMVQAFEQDAARLGLVKPEVEPRATRYIAPMLEMIATLEARGHAYRGDNGDVYYAVRSFPEYGKLSRRSLDELRAGERVAVDEAKRDPLDFVLWKAAKPDEPHWPSVFGNGRPGWHIECSAMSCRELGAPFDIHGGGWDLQFPHHENEIAQSEGALDTKFVNFWMHGAFLNMDREKMSKSLGNFFTTRDVLNELDPVRGGEELRFLFLRAHYRSEIEYTTETREDAANTLRGFYTALREVPPATQPIDWSNSFASRFGDALNDDLDTPVAFAVLHELRAEINRTKDRSLAGLLKQLGGAIGFFQQDAEKFLKGGPRIHGYVGSGAVSFEGSLATKVNYADSSIETMIKDRQDARKAKNFSLADEIRRKLEDAGIILEDKPNGTAEWRRK